MSPYITSTKRALLRPIPTIGMRSPNMAIVGIVYRKLIVGSITVLAFEE